MTIVLQAPETLTKRIRLRAPRRYLDGMKPFTRALSVAIVLVLLAACSHAKPAPPLSLEDGAGAPWTLAAQHGKIVLLYFGYTHCTDVCPLTLGTMARAVQQSGDAGKNAEIAFVTVDPVRDTPAVLAEYVKRYAAPMVGLTGTPAQLKQAYAGYHVWAEKMPAKHDMNYEMSHSSGVDVIAPDGSISSKLSWSDPTKAFVAAIKAAG